MSPTQLHVAEPPARYGMRLPVVLDCSVLAAALFQEKGQNEARQHITTSTLHAPYVLQSEFAHVALKKVTGGFGELARTGLDLLQHVRIDLHRIEEKAVFELAVEYKLSAYDASYLWLAGSLKIPLATFDQRLAKAAQKYLAGLP